MSIYSVFADSKSNSTSTLEFNGKYFIPRIGELWQIGISSISINFTEESEGWFQAFYKKKTNFANNFAIGTSLVTGDFETPKGAHYISPVPIEIFSISAEKFSTKGVFTIHFPQIKFFNLNNFGPSYSISLYDPIEREIIKIPANIIYHMIFKRVK